MAQSAWDSVRLAFLHWAHERQPLDGLMMSHPQPPHDLGELRAAVAQVQEAEARFTAALAAFLAMAGESQEEGA